MIDTNKLVIMLREASKVERYHTLPHHGSYTVGQHSFDMMSLAWVLMPVVTRNVMLAIMFHDLPERWTGDIPGPLKESDGEFGKRLAQLEARIEASLGLKVELTEDERMWVKVLDKVECFLWCHDQINMGNQNAVAGIGSLASWFMHNRVPKSVEEFLKGFKWTRTPDQLPK